MRGKYPLLECLEFKYIITFNVKYYIFSIFVCFTSHLNYSFSCCFWQLTYRPSFHFHSHQIFLHQTLWTWTATNGDLNTKSR